MNPEAIPLIDRIRGGFWGLLVGDALGVPYEFHSPEKIPPFKQIEFEPPAGFSRAHNVPSGTWSDDGAQALALLDSLLTCGELNLDDFAYRLADWYESGAYAVGGLVFDIGITTSAAIKNFQRGVPAAKAGPDGAYDNGNGALMRVLPLALWHQGPDAELARDARLQSLVTHGHIRSQLCCALYCLYARQILQGAESPWEMAVSALRALPLSAEDEAELEFHIRPDDFSDGTGSGYVVDSLRSTRWVMQQRNYEAVVKAAVALGHDTDTTACIAGGVAGLRNGVASIPERWLNQLRGREIAEPLLEKLLLQRAK